MQHDMFVDTKRLCRVCMAPEVDQPADLYDASQFGMPSLYEMLSAICAPVFAKSDDAMPEMPTRVCLTCRTATVAAYNLHQQCIETDRRLGEMVALMWELDGPRGDESVEGAVRVKKEFMPPDEIGPPPVHFDTTREHTTSAEAISPLKAENVQMIKVEELDLIEENENEESLLEQSQKMVQVIECSKCGISFSSIRSLQNHTDTGNCLRSSSFPCKVCGKVFDKHSRMYYHMRIHKGREACSQCNETFSDRSSLMVHMKLKRCSSKNTSSSQDEAQGGQVLCSKMDFSQTPEEGGTSEPSNIEGNDKPMVKIEQMELEEMSSESDQGTPVAANCLKCGMSFPSLRALKFHTKNKHDAKIYPCVSCPLQFPSLNLLIDHTDEKHTTETIHSCKTCNIDFATKAELRKHISTHAKPVECLVCEKTFPSKFALRSHETIHTGEKRFACELCKKRFRTASSKTRHMHLHKTGRSVECEICGSKLISKQSLKKHILTVHEGVRPYACSLCNLKCASTTQRNRHMLTHAKVKQFKCPVCPKAYGQSNELVKHVARTHGDGNAYACDRCDKTFRVISELRDHYLEHIQAGESAAGIEEVPANALALLYMRFTKGKPQQDGDGAGEELS